ncbi:tellurite resistance/C4-dicarboxylate transporter family protein [Tsukamurella sp. 1534]|uniref:tellurite resistance/C4-dicarboxylate transporter family protein n=1 Tax=Tsukamurella sp. 1534 TaxID=1151061 RepID=UPI0002D9D642|nr:tellurite resistance/C4-dicarboxylate transporter family protein [Tsukamurella sp. 1534]
MNPFASNRLVAPAPGHALGRFAFVMATGIVATLLRSTGADAAGNALFCIAAVAFAGLAAVAVVRLHTPSALRAEVAAAGFTAMAVPAGTSVLAGYLALLGRTQPALAVGAAGMLLWLVLGYLVPAQRVIDNTASAGADPLRGADGTWFLWGVATQSVAVVAGLLAPQLPGHGLAEVATLWWGLGMAQLVLVAALVAARMMLSPLHPGDEVAPYWVFFGSAAISVLAGSEVAALPAEQRIVSADFVIAVCVCLWAFATWLAPLLIALTAWQWRRSPGVAFFRLALWSIVFPVGMYGQATLRLGEATDIGWMAGVGHADAWVAPALWVAVAVAMVCAVTGRRPQAPGGSGA